MVEQTVAGIQNPHLRVIGADAGTVSVHIGDKRIGDSPNRHAPPGTPHPAFVGILHAELLPVSNVALRRLRRISARAKEIDPCTPFRGGSFVLFRIRQAAQVPRARRAEAQHVVRGEPPLLEFALIQNEEAVVARHGPQRQSAPLGQRDEFARARKPAQRGKRVTRGEKPRPARAFRRGLVERQLARGKIGNIVALLPDNRRA